MHIKLCLTFNQNIFIFAYRQDDLVNTLLMCLVLAFVLKFIAHTAILNAYLNMMAEIMRFADRQFFSVRYIVHVSILELYIGMVDMYQLLVVLSKVESYSS